MNWIPAKGDVLSQKIVMSQLTDTLPGVSFVAEESVESGAVPEGSLLATVSEAGSIQDARFITIDPIDGTSNYACGGSDWSVALAEVVHSEPVVAVIYLPGRGTMLTAVKGHGCHRNGRPLPPLPRRPLASSLVGAEMGGFICEDGLQRLLRFTSRSLGLRNVFSTTGNVDDFLAGITGTFMHLNGGWIWDFAPTALCVTEAGGVASDRHGKPLDFTQLMGKRPPTGVVFAASCDIRDECISILNG